MATTLSFGPEVLIAVIPVALVIALYPSPGALRDLSPGRISVPILTIAILAAIAMAPDAWDTLQFQLDDVSGDEHAEHNHWIGGTLLAVQLLVAGLLTATRRPGWKALGTIVGLAYLYLGVAALVVPDIAMGRWDVLGAVLALVTGSGYLAAVWLEGRWSTGMLWTTERSSPAR